MMDARVLKEKKKAINNSDDVKQQHGQRKITEIMGEHRSSRNAKSAGEKNKENLRKRKRPSTRSSLGADARGRDDSDSDEGPPAKRVVRKDDNGSDAIEDSDDGGNAFISFARPGKRPEPRQTAQVPVRSSRPVLNRAGRTRNATVSDGKSKGREKQVTSAATDRRVGRVTRTAAATTKERLQRGMAASVQGQSSEDSGDSESDYDGEEDEKGSNENEGGEGSDVVMVQASSSESEGGADEDEEMEMSEPDEAPANKTGLQGSRPLRSCATRIGARATATTARASRKSEDSANSDCDEQEEEDKDFEATQAVSKKGTAARGSTQRCMKPPGPAGPKMSRRDAVPLIASSSGSDDGDADEDEDMEEAGPDKAPVNKSGLRGVRPTRSCATRTVARVAAASKASQGQRRQKAENSRESASSDSSDEDESSSEDDDDDYARGRAASKKETAGRRNMQRQPNHIRVTDSDSSDEDESEKASGSDGDGSEAHSDQECDDREDEDVQLVHDDEDDDEHEEGSSSSSGEEDEFPVRRGRGRPPKDGSMSSKSASRQTLSARVSGKGKRQSDKGAAKAKAAGKDAVTPKNKTGKGTEDKASFKEKTTRTVNDKGPVERILSCNLSTGKFLVKLQGVAYRHTVHVTQSFLEKSKPSLLRFFLNRQETIEVDPEWLKVDRVLASRTVSRGQKGGSCQFLVKWRGLEYTDSTWEGEEDLRSEEDQAAIEKFKRINAPVGKNLPGNARALRQPGYELPTFCNGRSLRDYQQVSVRWMVNNYCQRRNCILGDEMGLGKTAQSISCLEVLRTVGGIPGPFLIVAPLSTLGHWQREIQTWTDMNVVLFAGAAADRAMIVEHEFYRSSCGSGGGGGSGSTDQEMKFNVLLVSYDTLLKERLKLRSVSWAAAVFDEAHRLKGLNSFTRATVEELDTDWLLLLTGTPIQNNMLELFSVLSLLDPDGYPSPEDFTARFGGAPGGPPPSVEQIRALQAALAPILLRRMKEDVEELPQKEEVVVWVELTAHQRAYYRALYEGQIGALLGGTSAKNLPSMRNLAMELRKLCCHPVLCEGLEEDLKLKLAMQRSQAPPGASQEYECPEVELLVRGSGKMVLLHKLLHKLRAEGRRVLIFSQFVIMLNVLEDYCNAVGFPVERIDGTVKSRSRQQAIDRFSAEDNGADDAFVFLLSTRAGGQGITLTAADTCIIYDSDWNPQNDLQAMARCHRIGQKKEVTVYRFISRDTYEMALFNCASRKYGLDEAILGFSGSSDPESDSARIAELLRHGAHGLLANMEGGLRQGEAFASEDINQILAARTEKRQIGSRAGNTFSVATFAVDDSGAGGEMGGHRPRPGHRRGRCRPKGDGEEGDNGEDTSDKDYWRTLMPEAVAALEARAAEGPMILGPRKRKQVNYNVNHKKYNPKLDSDDSSDDSKGGEKQKDGSEAAGGEGDGGKKRRRRMSKQQGAGSGEMGEDAGQEGAPATVGKGRGQKARSAGWTISELKAVEERLVALGPDRWDEIFEQLQPFKHSAEDVEAAARAMWALYDVAARLASERKEHKKKVEADARCAQIESIFTPLEEEDQELMPFKAAKVGDARPQAPGSVGGAAAGAGAGAGADATSAEFAKAPQAPPANTLDEFEEKLASAVLEKVPDFLRTALSGPAQVRRILREATKNLQNGKSMQELHQLICPRRQQGQKGATVTAEGAACGSVADSALHGLRAIYISPPHTASGFLNWWSRADDEALLIAAAQVGHVPNKCLRTIEYALRSQPLASRVVQRQASEQQQQPKELPAANICEAGPDAGAAGPSPAAATAAVAAVAEGAGPVGKSNGVGVDLTGPAVGEHGAVPAALLPRAPGPNAPVELSADEWRTMVAVLCRRLTRIITGTLTLHHKLATNANKTPLAVANILKPAKQLPSRPLAATPTPGAGAGSSSGSRGPSAAGSVNGSNSGQTAVAGQAVPGYIGAVIKQVVEAVTMRRASNAHATEMASNVGAIPAASGSEGGLASNLQEENHHNHHHSHHHKNHHHSSRDHPHQPEAQHQQQRPLDLQRRTSGEPNLQQPDRPAGAAATGAPLAGTGSSKPSGLRQGTLPFVRLGSSGTQPKSTPGVGEGSNGTKLLQTVAVATSEGGLTPRGRVASGKMQPAVADKLEGTQPGSAEKPIELDDSD